MSRLFLNILNMSLTASYCIITVIILRLFLKKQPKLFSYLLWSVVLFRLLCPVSFSSSYSLLQMGTDWIARESITEWDTGNINNGEHVVIDNNNVIPEDEAYMEQFLLAEDEDGMGEPPWIQKALDIAAWVWFAGIILLLCYSAGTAFYLRNSLKEAVRREEDQQEGAYFSAENITTPFVFGIIRPQIYLPAHLREEEKKFVLAHEKTHIARKDHLVKILAYAAVCLHWFNPLVWLAFVLMENDMEMSCDEAVIKKLGSDSKKDYSLSLLSLSTEKPFFHGSPLAFGEGKVEERVRNILAYRKRTFLTAILTAAVLIVVGAGLILNPAKEAEPETEPIEDIEDMALINSIDNPEAEPVEDITNSALIDFIDSYTTAFSNRDGLAMVNLYINEETALANAFLLEKDEDGYTMGVSSPMIYSFRYDISREKADIYYYAFTSDPQAVVWKEELEYTKIGEEYKAYKSTLQFWDSISSAEEFDAAYCLNGRFYFINYEESGFVDSINYQIENGNSVADNTVYEKPETAAAHILNLTGGEGTVEGNYTWQAMVRYKFADGSEVMIPMYQANHDKDTDGSQMKPVWIVDTEVLNAKTP